MAFSPYNSPIDPALYSTLALILMVAGLASSAFFFVQQVTTNKSQEKTEKIFFWTRKSLNLIFFNLNKRTLSNDITMATVSAVFMGLGMMFTMLTVGIYV